MSTKLDVTNSKFDCSSKRVLMRVDFNVPLEKTATGEMRITSTQRIDGALPTIRYLLSKEGGDAHSVVLMSHLGRPNGKRDPGSSLKPVADALETALKVEGSPVSAVMFLDDCVGEEVEKACREAAPKSVILLENLRFHVEEEAKLEKSVSSSSADDNQSAKRLKTSVENFREFLTKLGDVYVNDAFGAAHRAHSSVVGIDLPVKAAGMLMKKELDYFTKAMANPERPFVSIMGGTKVSDKILLIKNLLEKVDELIIGGGMAFAFLKVQYNMPIGSSLFNAKDAELVPEIVEAAKQKNVSLHFPVDFVCGDSFSKDANVKVFSVEQGIDENWLGLDIGPESRKQFAEVVKRAKTVVWNGPMGVFEFDKFAGGSKGLLDAVVDATANGTTTIIGGGDTATLCSKYEKEDKVSHVSTGGGASLEFMEGKVLPGVASLSDA